MMERTPKDKLTLVLHGIIEQFERETGVEVLNIKFHRLNIGNVEEPYKTMIERLEYELK